MGILQCVSINIRRLIMNRAIIPGSFDPITLGHLDIIERSSKMFDEIIVCVLVNPDKKTLFSIEERVELINKSLLSLNDCGKISVDSHQGLLVDYMKENNINTMIKGLRNLTDFEYESQMALLNKKMCPDIDTLFLITRPDLSYVSSSSIKKVVKFYGDISGLVPSIIEQDIIRKILE